MIECIVSVGIPKCFRTLRGNLIHPQSDLPNIPPSQFRIELDVGDIRTSNSHDGHQIDINIIKNQIGIQLHREPLLVIDEFIALTNVHPEIRVFFSWLRDDTLQCVPIGIDVHQSLKSAEILPLTRTVAQYENGIGILISGVLNHEEVLADRLIV